MKKCISFIITVVVVIGCFSLSVLADPIKIECENALDLSGGANIQSSEFASEEQLIGLKPEEIGVDAVAEYKINITEDGKYTFVLTYSAAVGDNMIRKADVLMDDIRSPLEMKQTENWEIFETASIEFELTTGEHIFKLLSPSDYDNTAVKTPNIDFFTYEKTGDLPKSAESANEGSEEVSDMIEIPPVEAIEPLPDEPTAAPRTSDTGIITFVLLSFVSGSILVRSKLGKKRI